MTLAYSYRGYDAYRGGNAYYTCDRCSQRHRRSGMLTEWTGLKVDAKCIDPRPPQMSPPNIYPEGIPFYDARPPADYPDRLQDDTALHNVVGGFEVEYGVQRGELVLFDVAVPFWDITLEDDSGAVLVEHGADSFVLTELQPDLTDAGLFSPLQLEQSPVEEGPTILEDDITFITGPVFP